MPLNAILQKVGIQFVETNKIDHPSVNLIRSKIVSRKSPSPMTRQKKSVSEHINENIGKAFKGVILILF